LAPPNLTAPPKRLVWIRHCLRRSSNRQVLKNENVQASLPSVGSNLQIADIVSGGWVTERNRSALGAAWESYFPNVFYQFPWRYLDITFGIVQVFGFVNVITDGVSKGVNGVSDKRNCCVWDEAIAYLNVFMLQARLT